MLTASCSRRDTCPRSARAHGRRLVYHLIATGQLDRDLGEDATPRTRASVGVAKLAAVTPLIEARLAAFPALSAVR